MSNLADKTAYRALSIIAKLVKEFEKLQPLDMTKQDDWDSCHAQNLLKGIVQSNGYEINYKKNGKPLKKNDGNDERK